MPDRARGDGQQGIAHIGDRRIGQQSLEVLLHQAAETADDETTARHDQHNLPPLLGLSRKPVCRMRANSTMAANFGAPAKKATIGVGAPS